MVAGRFPARDVVPYWIAQLVGGFGAVLVMAIVYSSQRDGLAADRARKR